MDLKQRKEVKELMQRIGKSAAIVKRKAHEFRMGKDALHEMGTIVLLADEVKEMMAVLTTSPVTVVEDEGQTTLDLEVDDGCVGSSPVPVSGVGDSGSDNGAAGDPSHTPPA